MGLFVLMARCAILQRAAAHAHRATSTPRSPEKRNPVTTPSATPDPQPNLADLAAVARATWALPGPVRAFPMPGGTNNLIVRLETGSGKFVLCVHRNSNANAPERLACVQDVLRRLDLARLPFAVPTPMLTVDGTSLAMLLLPSVSGDLVPVTLEPYLPGNHPAHTDTVLAEAGGTGLAFLDRALATMPVGDIVGATTWRSYGDLEHCHPLVPEPREALADLPLSEAVRSRLLAAFDALTARIPTLYSSLPQQLAHEDFAPSNVLAQQKHLTAILDFEFCSRDVRVMDLTVALSWWPGETFGTGDEWPILRAFARGYGQVIRLSGAEVDALPTLFLLRAYTSLIHRLGRYRQGVSSLDAVLDRATAALKREDWLRAHQDRLVRMLAEEVGER